MKCEHIPVPWHAFAQKVFSSLPKLWAFCKLPPCLLSKIDLLDVRLLKTISTYGWYSFHWVLEATCGHIAFLIFRKLYIHKVRNEKTRKQEHWREGRINRREHSLRRCARKLRVENVWQPCGCFQEGKNNNSGKYLWEAEKGKCGQSVS